MRLCAECHQTGSRMETMQVFEEQRFHRTVFPHTHTQTLNLCSPFFFLKSYVYIYLGDTNGWLFWSLLPSSDRRRVYPSRITAAAHFLSSVPHISLEASQAQPDCICPWHLTMPHQGAPSHYLRSTDLDHVRALIDFRWSKKVFIYFIISIHTEAESRGQRSCFLSVTFNQMTSENHFLLSLSLCLVCPQAKTKLGVSWTTLCRTSTCDTWCSRRRRRELCVERS